MKCGDASLRVSVSCALGPDHNDRSQLLACWCRPSPPHLASVAHDETAVDVDGLARHVIGVTAGEKAHDASHVFISVHSASIFLHIGVSTAPGQTQFEVILSVASTCAAVRVMLTTPALLAA
jgi:hypothetical protein